MKENPCVGCIAPCVQADGECLGPITEEQQRAINSRIVYDFEHDIRKARLIAPELVRAAINGTLEDDTV